MTTNFALSLSSDGIQLLQRADDGWLLVGNTAVDVPDLGAALAGLREDAMRLAPDGMRTKLLIPNEQIKYITLDTAQTSLDDVKAALQGATPYTVNELVIDFDRNGGRTFIAAVARETLDEAEAFAAQYNFAPVSFAAIAEPDTFKSEVFFGPSKTANGPVTRDAVPVVVIGKAKLPVDVVEDTPVFTPLARMADPESVVPPVEDPVLAVQTGDADGPAIAQPDTSTPPAAKPIVADAPKPVDTGLVAGTAKPVLSAPRAEDIATTGGFTSRRTAPVVGVRDTAELPSKADKKPAAITTQQAQTKRGKPRFLGLILTAILLVVMALVAVWASTLSEEDLASWFGYSSGGAVEVASETAPVVQMPAVPLQADDATVAAALTDPTDEVALPQVRATAMGRVLSPAQADRIYAATGVWQRAPRLPSAPRSETLSTAMPDIGPTLTALARPLMPAQTAMTPDLALIPPGNPPAAGTDFQRDADGFILATPQGTVTPQGAIVFAGAPSKRPPLRPQTAALPEIAEITPAPDTVIDAPDGVIIIAGRPSKVPPLRPEGLVPPPQELAFADPALADARPKLRPAGLAPEPEAEPEAAPEPETPALPDITDVVAAIALAAPASPFVTPTARAIRASPRPDPRPRNFARVVKRASDLAAQQSVRQQATAQPAAAVSNAPARSSGAVPGGVAAAATLENAIKLRDVNLIGVYGRPNNRRALVRLGNGRYVKVEVGSSLDGGQVTAIGDSALNYSKRGRTIALQLPNG